QPRWFAEAAPTEAAPSRLPRIVARSRTTMSCFMPAMIAEPVRCSILATDTEGILGADRVPAAVAWLVLAVVLPALAAVLLVGVARVRRLGRLARAAAAAERGEQPKAGDEGVVT